MYDFKYLTGSSLSELETVVETFYANGYTPVGNVISISGSYIQGAQSPAVDASAYNESLLPEPEGNNKNLLSRCWRMRHMDIGYVTSSQLSSSEVTSLGL